MERLQVRALLGEPEIYQTQVCAVGRSNGNELEVDPTGLGGRRNDSRGNSAVCTRAFRALNLTGETVPSAAVGVKSGCSQVVRQREVP